MSRIISKGEKEQMLFGIKENESYIFNPMGGRQLPWGFAVHGKVLEDRFCVYCNWPEEWRKLF